MTARRQLPRGAESLEQRGAVLVLHVDERKVRLPVEEDPLDVRKAGSGPDREQAVVQRELDQVDHRAAVVQDQRAATFILVGLTFRRRRTARPCTEPSTGRR